MIDYIRDPKAIYARSFALIRAEADVAHLPQSAHGIARRIIHACGMPEIAQDLRITADFYDAAKAALDAHKPVFVDAEMVKHGIIGKNINIICTLNDPEARALGTAKGTTRSAAAVELWAPHLAGALVVIGNAPTALFALLELIGSGAPRPAAIVAFPVGFVGAAESKAELVANPRGIPYATLLGRRGGSAMASAAVNALTRGEE
ncbi:precorrin-8X methylmutase [Aestuariivirga sp.]|uniref:precorrin-8X methylmutase n=1 Tax=Aestuariivirga sp. TaxID=2650926 RepID=UPI0039E5CC6A